LQDEQRSTATSWTVNSVRVSLWHFGHFMIDEVPPGAKLLESTIDFNPSQEKELLAWQYKICRLEAESKEHPW
jgi:hypothetical protein